LFVWLLVAPTLVWQRVYDAPVESGYGCTRVGELGKSLRRGLYAPVVHPFGEFHHSKTLWVSSFMLVQCKVFSFHLFLLVISLCKKREERVAQKRVSSRLFLVFSPVPGVGGRATRQNQPRLGTASPHTFAYHPVPKGKVCCFCKKRTGRGCVVASEFPASIVSLVSSWP
jgi:hypothetical protein